MKIIRIDLINLGLPLKKPIRLSYGETDQNNTLLIKLYTANGLIGWGESSLDQVAMGEPEDIPSGIGLIKNKIAPLILNKKFPSVLSFKQKVLDKFPKHPVTKIGLEGAFYHLLSQKKKIYLGKLFGAKTRTLLAGETVCIKDKPEEILQEVEKLLKGGYQNLKVKIMPDHDFWVLDLIREKYPNLSIAVDANTAYQENQVDYLKKLDQYNLSFIEQPFTAEKFEAHAQLQKKIKTPVCLDESIQTLDDAQKAVSLGACRVINIKPARLGSYYDSIELHEFCLENKISVFCGGRWESGIGKAANLALAGLPGFNLPLDMSSSLEFFTDDVIDPLFDTEGGKIKMPSSPGLGFKINENKIKQYTCNLEIIK